MESCSFPYEWKKGNVVPIRKKDNKQCFENYHPESLLPMCGKIFEKLVFMKCLNFSLKMNLSHPINWDLNLVTSA